MEKQGSKEKYVTTKPRRPLGTIRILREAHKITIKNGKLVVSIILPVLISYTILAYFSDHVVLEPVLKDLSSKAALMTNDYSNTTDSSSTGIFTKDTLKDLRYYVGLKLVILFISCVILLIFVVASIYSSSEAYIGKVLSLKDTLCGIKGRIKRPIITSFWMAMISFSFIGLFLIIFGIITVMITDGFFIVLTNFLASILSVVCYLYVAALWMLSLVVSVLEEKSYGLKGIDRAGELMKGKRIQGSVLKLLFTLTVGMIYYIVIFVISAGKANYKLISSKSMMITVPTTWLICLVKLFMFEVFTVFYHECKKSEEAEAELGFYAMVTTDSGEA